jgi:hypothetical protein
MAIHDKKDPITLTASPKEGEKKSNEIGYSAQSAAPVVDREHLRRHNEAEQHDKKLAAMLQANWGKHVEAAHRLH